MTCVGALERCTVNVSLFSSLLSLIIGINSDSLYSGTRSEGNGATGGVVVTSSCLEGIT